MTKTFVLDTCILIHDPYSVYNFEDNDVVVPGVVIEELDDLKVRQDEVGRNAREFGRVLLKELGSGGDLAKGITLPGGGRFWVEANHCDPGDLPKFFDPEKRDNRILGVAVGLKNAGRARTVVVSRDYNVQIKAMLLGLKTEDYYHDKIDFQGLYTGFTEVEIAPEEVDAFYRNGLLGTDRRDLMPHQFVLLKDLINPAHSALARHLSGQFHPLVHARSAPFGISARNKEQKFAMEILMDDGIKVATLVGRAGTGKTLLAIAAGMHKLLEEKAYKKLLITRPIVPVGRDLGYLPGNKDEKLRPWMQPVFDNLDYIFDGGADDDPLLQQYLEKKIIELEAMTHIRGRTMPRAFIICDEAQNLTPQEIKTLVTRVGDGTKIVFTGDPEQIDHPYLDSCNNGLSILAERFKDEVLAAHITLTRGERSDVAEMGARKL